MGVFNTLLAVVFAIKPAFHATRLAGADPTWLMCLSHPANMVLLLQGPLPWCAHRSGSHVWSPAQGHPGCCPCARGALSCGQRRYTLLLQVCVCVWGGCAWVMLWQLHVLRPACALRWAFAQHLGVLQLYTSRYSVWAAPARYYRDCRVCWCFGPTTSGHVLSCCAVPCCGRAVMCCAEPARMPQNHAAPCCASALWSSSHCPACDSTWLASPFKAAGQHTCYHICAMSSFLSSAARSAACPRPLQAPGCAARQRGQWLDLQRHHLE
jgi:hypothetical protein